MIELRDVTFGYDDRTVLDRVSLAVDEGELVLVAGPTGSGKSTLLGVLTGLVPRFTGGRLAGEVLVDGRSVTGQPPRGRARAGSRGDDGRGCQTGEEPAHEDQRAWQSATTRLANAGAA